MRWTKRLRYRWPFLNGLLSSPEEQPADAAALAALHATQLEGIRNETSAVRALPSDAAEPASGARGPRASALGCTR